jgi:flagellar biosynthesis/type III secretory pathway M-ring protein FliF/YscJ
MWISTMFLILIALLTLTVIVLLLIIWMNSQKIDILVKDLDETKAKLKYVVKILESKGIDLYY